MVPDRVGKSETILDTSARSVEDVLADLEANGATWVTYTFHNPSTGTEQLKRTYLQLRDDMVFGSGYYVLDSQVQAIAYNQILEYVNDGRDAAFADINALPEEPTATYVFVADPDTGTTWAQGADPDLIGMPDWGRHIVRPADGRPFGSDGDRERRLGKLQVHKPGHRRDGEQARLAHDARRAGVRIRVLLV